MKIRNLFYYVSVAAVLMLTTQCEGPTGADGQDGTASCLQCHAEDLIVSVQVEFKQSTHKGGLIAVDYAGGREGCAQCHSHEGFMNFALTGEVDGDVMDPNAWECSTCHKLHTEFEYSDFNLRLDSAITLIADETTVVDLGGSSNLCANCHQARTQAPNMASPGAATFTITSTHYGPHHGPQTNLMYGVTFAEIAGAVSYPAAGSHAHASAACVTCHMGTYNEGSGGHTYNPNIDNCITCHSSLTSLDHNGLQTDVEELLLELQELLLAEGVIAPEVEGDDTIGYYPVTGEHDMVKAQAFYNYIGIEEDRSLGVHNPPYIKALLKNSIDALK